MTDDTDRSPTPSERLTVDGWEVIDPAVLDGPPQEMELTSVEQLRVMSEPMRLRLLAAVSRRPGSAKEVAARFGVPTTRLYHHLDLLEEHGFIEVVATRRSGARTERCYGAPPRSSIRPGKAMVEAEDRTALADTMAAVVELGAASLRESVLASGIDRDDDSVVVSLSTMRLTREQQRRFTEELTDLNRRMMTESKENDRSRDRGEQVEDEAVQLLLVLSPDALAPRDLP